MAEAVGLLFSQVGYDLGGPVRVLVRGPEGLLGPEARLAATAEGTAAVEAPLKPWGACWGTHWWAADLTGRLVAGDYGLKVLDAGGEKLAAGPLRLGDCLVFRGTAAWVGWRQLEKRACLAAVPPGWFDAGALWQEVPSHALMITGLADLLRLSGARLDATDREKTAEKLKDGAMYLALCQDKCEALGLGAGVVHDLAKAPESLSSNDAFMAALAWAKAAEVLAAKDPEGAKAFARRAGRALDWIESAAKPVSTEFNMAWNQGWPEGLAWPEGWGTRWLMLALWAELLLAAGGHRRRPDRIESLSAEILARQVPEAEAEHGLWGHFYAYAGSKVTEKAWSHGMPPKANGQNTRFGSDMGAVYAHPLHCFLDGLRLFPGHALAGKWDAALRTFAGRYFKPACATNPFGLLPRGVFGGEGPLHFAGLWHGCNAVYGQAAALGFEFEALTGDADYGRLAWANLQWICGLNAGITREAVDTGCVIRTHDVGPDEALPASMIQELGTRTAGNWTTIRGSVCNGFSTGRQFTYDVPPLAAQDAPSSFTDEDWITHAGGFLMGLARSLGREA